MFALVCAVLACKFGQVTKLQENKHKETADKRRTRWSAESFHLISIFLMLDNHMSPWITLQCRQRHYVMWSEGGSKSVKHGEASWVSSRSGKTSHFATLSHDESRQSGCCRYVLWVPPESRLSRCGCREIWFEKSWNVDLTYDCCRILQNWLGNFWTGIGDEVCFDLWVCTLVMPC